MHYSPESQLPILVMEYLPHTLYQLLEKRQVKHHYSILLDIANGLDYLHQRHPPIIHRDLTARNVLLTVHYTAKISDLGMSKPLEKQRLTTNPGNFIIMPPEAHEHNPVYDHTIDIFSFGCLILHILTGQIPKPTKEFVPNPKDPESFVKVSEWDRRASYVEEATDHYLLDIAKHCLKDKPSERPNITHVVQKLQGQYYEHW